MLYINGIDFIPLSDTQVCPETCASFCLSANKKTTALVLIWGGDLRL